ncbi:DUF938 domain-containing protein [Solimonas terrae]|uniref:DUF938 domain-containing protein n=1 Tax=Solimonas terrae TaxID=1396819 RepID=A0A6M2BS23_9GAMM|nr:DUF938 domain-containing protein [Solimonas terrae]NGY05130.1 DUF938 domain-containing protein [Solimonas terrae]
MRDKPHAPSCDRNREPILAVLKTQFADRRRVLEIGSGTGQHAVYFAAAMPQLQWQTSERVEHHDGIRAWLDEAKLENALPPIALDVAADVWPSRSHDAAFTANTLHIMSWPEVEATFAGLHRALQDDATVVAYGPFNYGGEFTSASNADFDQWLKARGAHMGIRDAEVVDALARRCGFVLIDDVAMPSNNRCRIWRRD